MEQIWSIDEDLHPPGKALGTKSVEFLQLLQNGGEELIVAELQSLPFRCLPFFGWKKH